jgi:hypothetical protein
VGWGSDDGWGCGLRRLMGYVHKNSHIEVRGFRVAYCSCCYWVRGCADLWCRVDVFVWAHALVVVAHDERSGHDDRSDDHDDTGHHDNPDNNHDTGHDNDTGDHDDTGHDDDAGDHDDAGDDDDAGCDVAVGWCDAVFGGGAGPAEFVCVAGGRDGRVVVCGAVGCARGWDGEYRACERDVRVSGVLR